MRLKLVDVIVIHSKYQQRVLNPGLPPCPLYGAVWCGLVQSQAPTQPAVLALLFVYAQGTQGESVSSSLGFSVNSEAPPSIALWFHETVDFPMRKTQEDNFIKITVTIIIISYGLLNAFHTPFTYNNHHCLEFLTFKNP